MSLANVKCFSKTELKSQMSLVTQLPNMQYALSDAMVIYDIYCVHAP